MPDQNISLVCPNGNETDVLLHFTKRIEKQRVTLIFVQPYYEFLFCFTYLYQPGYFVWQWYFLQTIIDICTINPGHQASYRISNWLSLGTVSLIDAFQILASIQSCDVASKKTELILWKCVNYRRAEKGWDSEKAEEAKKWHDKARVA